MTQVQYEDFLIVIAASEAAYADAESDYTEAYWEVEAYCNNNPSDPECEGGSGPSETECAGCVQYGVATVGALFGWAAAITRSLSVALGPAAGLAAGAATANTIALAGTTIIVAAALGGYLACRYNLLNSPIPTVFRDERLAGSFSQVGL